MTYPRVTVSHESTIPKSHFSALTTTVRCLQEDREQHVQELLSTNTAGMKGKPSFVLRAVGTWGHPEFWSQGGGGAGMAGHRRTQSMNGTWVHVLASIFSSSCIRDDN